MFDFTHNSNFMDYHRGVVGNSLVGPDGILLVRNQVEDNEIRDSVEDSVLSTVEFMLNVTSPSVRQSLPSVGFCGSKFSVNQNVSVLAADSGTQFIVLTLPTASLWSGCALAELNFIAATGQPFKVFGGDDLVGEIRDENGVWRRHNLG